MEAERHGQLEGGWPGCLALHLHYQACGCGLASVPCAGEGGMVSE